MVVASSPVWAAWLRGRLRLWCAVLLLCGIALSLGPMLAPFTFKRCYGCLMHVTGQGTHTPPRAGGPQTRVLGDRNASAAAALPGGIGEVVVLTMPWRQQWLKAEAQLKRHGINALRFHGVDMRDPQLQLYHNMLNCRWDYSQSLGELAYSLSWLAIMDWFQHSSTADTLLVLEDDVILHSDFRAELAARVSGLPHDRPWTLLWLGASQDRTWSSHQVIWPNNRKPFTPPYYVPIITSGSYAVAVRRAVVPSVVDKVALLNGNVDTTALTSLLPDCTTCFVLFPNVVIADVRKSNLREGKSLRRYAERCHWNLTGFDIEVPV